MFNIIQKRKIWFVLSGAMVLISIVSLMVWGLQPGIDFTGGSMLEIRFVDRVLSNDEVKTALADLNLPYLSVQPTANNGVIIKTKNLTETEHQEILKKLIGVFDPQAAVDAETMFVDPKQLGIEGAGTENLQITAVGDSADTLKKQQGLPNLNSAIVGKYLEELRFDSVGPTIGKELRQKSIVAIIIVNIAIILYIAYVFRKVSYPVESWKYGVSAVIALIHDIVIVTGIFSILGHFLGYQVDSLFVTALLTILGFSVHDTIVTFDRTRENLRHHQDKTFEDVVNLSVNQTIVRSINTTMTALISLIAIFLFGGESTRLFALALICGFVVGTYSSIFLASPLLLLWYKVKKY